MAVMANAMDNEKPPFRESRGQHFTDAQKWALLQEWDQCFEWGSKSAFCRRVGVWSGTPTEWARQRADGRLKPPVSVEVMDNDKKKEAARRLPWEEREELKRLRAENQRLHTKLQQSEAAVEILGKAAALLDSMAKGAELTDPVPEPIPGMPAWLRNDDGSSLPQIPPRP